MPSLCTIILAVMWAAVESIATPTHHFAVEQIVADTTMADTLTKLPPAPSLPKKQSVVVTTTTGFRVRFFYSMGANNQARTEAMRARDTFKSLFGNVRADVIFDSPRWVCECGDFITRNQANDFVRRMAATKHYDANKLRIVNAKVYIPRRLQPAPLDPLSPHNQPDTFHPQQSSPF